MKLKTKVIKKITSFQLLDNLRERIKVQCTFPESGQRLLLVGYWTENYFLMHLKAKKRQILQSIKLGLKGIKTTKFQNLFLEH